MLLQSNHFMVGLPLWLLCYCYIIITLKVDPDREIASVGKKINIGRGQIGQGWAEDGKGGMGSEGLKSQSNTLLCEFNVFT